MPENLPQKIATRIRNAVTGEEYYIGTVGSVEKVAITLSLPDGATPIDWTEHTVEVEIPALEEEHAYPINALGECTFEVPMGVLYHVILPVLSSYAQPQEMSMHATLAARSIQYTYQTGVQEESVLVQARVVIEGGGYDYTIDDMAGLDVTLTTSDGQTTTVAFDSNLEALFSVPYGTIYTISYPYCEGYRLKRSTSGQLTAGGPTRVLMADYIVEDIGIYAMDANGNKYYTPEEVSALQDPSIAKYLVVNTSTLQASSRNDGTTGNGFILDLTGQTISGRIWAGSSVEFDRDLLPFVTAAGQTSNKTYYAGAYNTSAIISIGVDISVSTPAASGCAAKTLSIDSSSHKGLLPAYGQYEIMKTNKSLLNSFAAAAGYTIVDFLGNSSWWTSCQYSNVAAVHLTYGDFRTSFKANWNYNVLLVYDLKS